MFFLGFLLQWELLMFFQRQHPDFEDSLPDSEKDKSSIDRTQLYKNQLVGFPHYLPYTSVQSAPCEVVFRRFDQFLDHPMKTNPSRFSPKTFALLFPSVRSLRRDSGRDHRLHC